MKTRLIKDATIINEGQTFTGSVLIKGEQIERIFLSGEKLPGADEVIDANGLLLLPGVIDDHVHFRDPGLTYKGDMQSESRAAAAGGVTSYLDMPNTIPQTITPDTLEAKFEHAAATSLINYSFYFGVTNDNVEYLSQLDRRKVCGIKLFMGSSTGNMLVDQRESLLRIFGSTDLLIAAHCEDSARIATNTARIRATEGEDPDVWFHPLIRDAEACYSSTARAIELADQANARLHVLHISTLQELALFEAGNVTQKRITAEACIPHLLFCDEDYNTLGSLIKCNPAVKFTTDRGALQNAVKNNLIDVIGTDHAPHLLSEKEGGALKAVSGIPMVQFSLVSMLQLCEERIFTYEQVIQKMCHAPAQLYGIRKRGFIREGYFADLVLVDPQRNWLLTSDKILSKCGWSPLEGRSFSHCVVQTFVNGQPVWKEGVFDENFRGKALIFE